MGTATHLMAFCLFFDCIQGTTQGIIRGLGVQYKALKY